MKPILKTIIASACSILALSALSTAHAEISGDVVKIGFITDISGPYSDTDGSGGVEAVKMAIEDFGGKVNGKKLNLFLLTI
jgi:branched-chain amino acid transport system substrate-binding protein